MKSTTTGKTLEALHNLFTAYRLPEQLVSDNGPQFTSSEFEWCMRANSIKHIWTSPYHPASSGEAERFVQTFKHAMRAGEKDDWVTSWQTMVCTRLDYWNCHYSVMWDRSRQISVLNDTWDWDRFCGPGAKPATVQTKVSKTDYSALESKKVLYAERTSIGHTIAQSCM